MSLLPYKVTAIKNFDATGQNVLPFASVSVLNKTGGYASLKTDETGATPLANPFVCDANGEKEFWMLGGEYLISVSGGQSWEIHLSGASDLQMIDNVAALASTPAVSGTVYYLKEYISGTGIGGGELLAYASAGATNNVTIFASATGGVLFKRINYDRLSVHMAGARGDGVTNDTAAFQAAIVANRGTSYSILDTIGGSIITAYDNGLIDVPPGTYILSYDTFNITQDMALGFVGCGSRHQSNFHIGKTVLNFTGTSSGYAIKIYGNGGRGISFFDLDIVYTGNTFTGDLIDTMDAPGLNLTDCYVGTAGTTGGTRFQTANSLIRSTYDEFIVCTRSVFNGAVSAWWSDDVRIEHSNTFGGSNTTFEDCVFYDFTGDMLKHSGARTRASVDLISCTYNPISMVCSRAINFVNVDGLNLVGGHFTPSTSFGTTNGWIRALNCSGTINGMSFGDLSTAGIIGGQFTLSSNNFFTTNGLTLDSGVITSHSNEFSTGTNGYIVSSPSSTLCINLGPDLFKSGVTNSYNITDSSLIGGCINYNGDNDASTNAFVNTSGRIRISNNDNKKITVSTTPYTINKKDTGRHFIFAGSANQVCNVPVSTPGTSFKITKVSSFDLDIDRTSTNNFYCGVGGVKTKIKFLAADIGGTANLDAYATVGYISDVQGTVTLT